MELVNIAYYSEYLAYRMQFDYLFDESHKYDEDQYALSDGKHIIKVCYYKENRKNSGIAEACTSMATLYDENGTQVSEIKNVSHKIFWFSEIEHNNGNRYLIFSIDLYGYSIMNLRNYKVYNFIPKKSFVGGETFIWTKAVYCKTNNILAVEGCFWACPFSLEFYDFSEPDNLPLNFICSTYDMENEIDIDYDVELSGWNDQGKIVMKCHVNEVETEKTLDVLVFGKQK